jgi:hypothetical protein
MFHNSIGGIVLDFNALSMRRSSFGTLRKIAERNTQWLLEIGRAADTLKSLADYTDQQRPVHNVVGTYSFFSRTER